MIRKIVMSVIVAAGLLAGIQAATAQTASSPVRCMYTWCWTHVMVVPDAAGTPVARVTWNEFRMPKNLSGVTLGWILVGSPDYELRPDSVHIIGTNVAGASAQFPLRQSTWPSFRWMTSTRLTSCTRINFAYTRRDRRRTRCPSS